MKRFVPLAMTALLVVGPASAVEPASPERLDEVAKKGAEVMPFSLDKTLHVFAKNKRGGRQEVLAKDPRDAGQIRLIREHLSALAKDFSRGDFGNPAKIHGDDMPGLAEMKAAEPGKIGFDYRELPKGARIDYSAKDERLIDAIHRYFDAQLSDHARHAMPGGHHHFSMPGQ